mgnify:FL=1
MPREALPKPVVNVVSAESVREVAALPLEDLVQYPVFVM